MRKIAYGAGAVLALATVAMAKTTAGAKAPTLQINGNTIMNVYAVNQHKHNNGKGVGFHFSNDISDLVFLIAGQTTSGIEYGYKINLQAFSNSNPIIDQNYVQFISRFGTLQFGNVVGPEDSMIEDGISLLGGTGGPDGGYKNVYNFAAFALRGNDTIGDTDKATKMVYYTPEVYNFRLSVAYTPDTTHLGDKSLNTNSKKGNSNVPGQRRLFPKTSAGIDVIGLHSWAFGLSYKKELGNWGLNVNGAYINDDSYLESKTAGQSREKLRGTRAYQLGAVVGYRLHSGHLLQVGGGYLNNNRSRMLKHALGARSTDYGFKMANGEGDLYRGKSGQAYNLGASYTMGAYKFAGGYQNLDRRIGASGKARTRVYTVTADVVPVSGLKFYGEIDHVSSHSTDNAVSIWNQNLKGGTSDLNDFAYKKNTGTVFIMGTKVSF